jgi:molybdopterin-guanine dinucleotide biosynthesis protein A
MRMGGLDKGLAPLHGTAMALCALQRLRPQVGAALISANRNLETYAAFGTPVWPDHPGLGDYAGPLAGFLSALSHSDTPYLVTVPCDAPLFPMDLVQRLARALVQHRAAIAVASCPDEHGQMRAQPVFCLMATALRQSLLDFTRAGGRKVQVWASQQACVQVPFNRPGDDPGSFFNANSLLQLQQLESAHYPARSGASNA